MPEVIYAGTHPRAQHSDAADSAFGIYAFRRGESGWKPAGLIPTPAPGWLCASPDGRRIYAVNEVRKHNSTPGGSVSAFAVQPDGSLRALNHRRTPAMPCHCAVDASGRFLLVASFGGGAVRLFALNDDGSIGVTLDSHTHHGSSIHPVRQAKPHPHAVVFSPDGRFVLVPDLGTDRIEIYEFAGALRHRPDLALRLPPGSGPRHAVFSPDGSFVYVMNEMSAAIATLAWDEGRLALLAIDDCLPPDFAGLRSGAAIGLSPCGNHLYATTRSHGSSGPPPQPGLNTLVWFKLINGLPQFAGRVDSGGTIPRAFAFDRRGHLLVAHQGSGTIAEWSLAADGAPQGPLAIIATPVPTCILPLELGDNVGNVA